jgi:ornithine carbamoyltransferase
MSRSGLEEKSAASLALLQTLADTPVAASDAAAVAGTAVHAAREVCAGLRCLRGIGDLTAVQARALLALARVLKATLRAERTAHRGLLPGATLAMVFEKPSLRTRVSFEVGMYHLGGHALYLQPADIGMGKRETVADTARNLERMVDGIMARVYRHATVRELAAAARVPVINGLCDREHPCQALADWLTILERRGSLVGCSLGYIGDGNNVAHSLLLLGALLGAKVTVACPPGYAPLPEVLEAAGEAAAAGGSVQVTDDPRAAARGAEVLYTDVWASMGQEGEAAERAAVFAAYQVTPELAELAASGYLFLHCLPAHRGEEVAAEVIDGPHSVVFDQAENRLHAQKAVLSVLLR